MRRFYFLIMIEAIVLIGFCGLLWAQPPLITVTVKFDKDYYEYGEPLGVEVTVTNTSGKYLLVNKGFSTMIYYLEMRLIDPAGRLLQPKRTEQQLEFPDSPPLSFVLCNGVPTQVASYEVLPPRWSITQRIDDISAYYPMKFPGHYSAEVQLSVMIFKQSDEPFEDLCHGDINNYELLAVIKSGSQTLQTEGNTEVYILPAHWHLSWKGFPNKQYSPNQQYIQVQIKPESGKTVGDYSTEFIQLNNVKAVSVQVLSSMIKAYFDPRESVESLGEVEADQWYSVVVSGLFKSGGFWGGGQKVKIRP